MLLRTINAPDVCNLFADYQHMRRLEFESKYDIKCSLLKDEVVMSTLMTTANSKFNQINAICDTGNKI